MNDIYFVFLNFFIIYVWFKTDAFIEYFKYIRLFNKLFKINEYYAFREKYNNINYHTFLLLNYNNFFIRLITCPSCISVWVTLSTLLFYNNKFNFFSNFAYLLILYYIVSILKDKYDRIDNI
ncbi:MAG: hypothetical protein EBU90_13755 [Proteobacteria bacterium]|nr:hypothetical protein [Pseudomonadota bacterium]